jgi:hypothetical protein
MRGELKVKQLKLLLAGWGTKCHPLSVSLGSAAPLHVVPKYDLPIGLALYCKRKVFYYYHRNLLSKAFYTLHYSHVTH